MVCVKQHRLWRPSELLVRFPEEFARSRDYEGKRGNPSYWPYSHRNPSKVIFRSPARSGIPTRVN